LKVVALSACAAAFLWSTACGSASSTSEPASAPPASGHEHHAPHGGTLVELGSEFAHVELVLDSATGTLTAYVLDGEAEESVRLTQPSLKIAIENPAPGVPGAPATPAAVEHLELLARADVLTGETVGDTSEFSATSQSLRGRTGLKGTIEDITVKGEEFRAVPFQAVLAHGLE
jgi:hypothetical protein